MPCLCVRFCKLVVEWTSTVLLFTPKLINSFGLFTHSSQFGLYKHSFRLETMAEWETVKLCIRHPFHLLTRCFCGDEGRHLGSFLRSKMPRTDLSAIFKDLVDTKAEWKKSAWEFENDVCILCLSETAHLNSLSLCFPSSKIKTGLCVNVLLKQFLLEQVVVAFDTEIWTSILKDLNEEVLGRGLNLDPECGQVLSSLGPWHQGHTQESALPKFNRSYSCSGIRTPRDNWERKHHISVSWRTLNIQNHRELPQWHWEKLRPLY